MGCADRLTPDTGLRDCSARDRIWVWAHPKRQPSGKQKNLNRMFNLRAVVLPLYEYQEKDSDEVIFNIRGVFFFLQLVFVLIFLVNDDSRALLK